MVKEKNRFLFWWLYCSLVLIFFLSATIVFYPSLKSASQAANWSVPSSMPSGMKYSGSTYYASNPNEFLYAISKGGTVELTNNINLSGKNYVPFTKSSSLEINGNGYSILGVTINTSNKYVGLIGSTSQNLTIRQLNLVVNITYSSTTNGSVGGLVGYAQSTLTIEGCNVYGSINATKSAKHFVGGLVGGTTSTSKITESINYANVSAIGGSYVGGVVGYSSNTNDSIQVCANYGDIDGGTGYVGGLVGYYNGKSTFSKNFNDGDVSATSASGIGGLIGGGTLNTVENCYNTGNVSGNSSSKVGGLVGTSSSSVKFSYCYSTGNIKGGLGTTSKTSTFTNKTVTPKHTCNLNEITYSQTNSSEGLVSVPLNGGEQGGGSSDENVEVYINLTKIVATADSRTDLCGSSFSSSNSYCYGGTYDDGLTLNISFGLFVGGTNRKTVTCNYTIYPEENTFEKSLTSHNLNLDYYYFNKNESGRFNNLIYPHIRSQVQWIGNVMYYSIKYVRMAGFRFSYSGSTLTITPRLQYKIGLKSASDGINPSTQRVYSDVTQEGSSLYYTNTVDDKGISATSVTISNPASSITSTILTNKGDIKNKSLGSQYVTNSSINDGNPVLKDFYWLYQ